MKTIKSYLSGYPEYYLLIVTLLSFYEPPFTINALGLCLCLVFIFQIISKIRITGIVIGCLFFLLNLYLIFALIDEFNEFTTINSSAVQLAVVGSVLISVNVVFSVLTIRKYLPPKLLTFS